ncbi:MAG: hypothetical protein RL385_2795 [Pseudomonadota bacterium]|jgi:CubicO group peptidase (beta-lactamase class C family)
MRISIKRPQIVPITALLLCTLTPAFAYADPPGTASNATTLTAPPSAKSGANTGDRARRDLLAELAALQQTSELPGVSAAVVVDGKIVFAEGLGHVDLAGGPRVTADTPFRLASVTKTFLGVALMRAVEQHRVRLDQRVALDNPQLDGELITLRELANHTSSLRDSDRYICGYLTREDQSYLYPPLQAFCPEDPPTELHDFLSAYLAPGGSLYVNENFATAGEGLPGETFSYSNVGAAVVGRELGRVVPGGLRAYMQREIFEPLRLRHTGFDPHALDPRAPYARGYDVFEEGGALSEVPEYFFPTWPDGGLFSSARDLATFMAMVMNDGRLGGARVLAPSSVREMLRFTASGEEDGETMEYAVFWTGIAGLIGHAGGDPGATTFMAFTPDRRVGVVALINRGDAVAGEAIRPLVYALLAYGNKATR